jgi:hypothetical protein
VNNWLEGDKMNKVKFFHAGTQVELEYNVEQFIKDKDVINISYAINPDSHSYQHLCCVLYR